MSRPTIHFAYTVPLGRGLIRRAIDKVLRMFRITPLHRWALDFLIPWQQPIRSPHSISYNLLQAFKQKKKYKVRFYNMYEKVLPRMREQDIFIGQPLPQDGFNASRPQSDERSSITSRVVREYKNNPVFLIMPYTHDPLYVSWSKELVADLGKNPNGGLILVGGKIWERNWDKSPFAQIKIPPKIHVEMGINPADYPRVKHSFNPKGKRRFFYIGHDAWYKNTSQLEEIAKSLPDFEFAHIGGGSLKGWKKIDEFASLTPQYMSEIARNYDIFVNTSSADAQATTILENMCFGFPIATTYEAGYDFPSLIQLSTTDTVYNTKALLRLQDMDESELLEIANVNRKAAESFHGWSKFTDTILNFMKI